MILKVLTVIVILLNMFIVHQEIKELYFLKTRIRIIISGLLLMSYVLASCSCVYDLISKKEIGITGFLICGYLLMLIITSSFQAVYYETMSKLDEEEKSDGQNN
ncbi:hypothetical protein NNC92_04280 [Streptococcus mutans]|uniref:hypothetical protein n=1 Tax=Streptococcus mutans TaxID=1309 RepID=UPI001CFE54AA|nr:hypothetical protein [Streptococcus mutans]MCB5097762.1 hypothetical protein [Streptococcus mutans]MDT9519949.1 hypothetical protein [Streptococcus mutans]